METGELWDCVASAAQESGACASVHLVGGPVRDSMLDRPLSDVPDLDLTVVGDAPAVGEVLAWQWGGDLVVHERFRTATWTPPEMAVSVDLVTARKERYDHPGALPEVEGGDLRDDLQRRDFTINAMAMQIWPDPRWELTDPCAGAGDLAAGLLRVLHPGSFVDDPTRILRLARLAVRLGFRPDLQTESLLHTAVTPNAAGETVLDTVSGDRLRHEWELICGEPDPPRVVRWLMQCGAGKALGLDVAAERGMESLERGWAAARAGDRGWSPRIAAALLLTGADTGRAAHMLALRGGPAARLQSLATIGQRLGDPVELASGEWSLDRLLERTSDEERGVLEASYPAAQQAIQRYENEVAGRPPLLMGADLVAAGMPSGPEIGESLRAVRDAQLRGTVMTRAEAFGMLGLHDPYGA